MTPEEQAKLDKMYQDYSDRQVQQIRYPLDEASKNSLGVPVSEGTGNATLTQTITIGAGGGSASVPAAYQGSLILNVDGVNYEIGYIRTV